MKRNEREKKRKEKKHHFFSRQKEKRERERACALSLCFSLFRSAHEDVVDDDGHSRRHVVPVRRGEKGKSNDGSDDDD